MVKLLFCMAACISIDNFVSASNLLISLESSRRTVLQMHDFTNVLGQTGEEPIRKEPHSNTSNVKLGVKIGLNSSNADFNKGFPPPPVPIETLWKAGLVFGLMLEVPIYQRLWLQQDYLYSQMGGEIRTTGVSYSFSYISLPVMLKYKFNRRIAFGAGPQFDVLVQAREKTNGSSLKMMHDVEERNIGATIGIEVELLKNISFEARYMHGLNHVGLYKLPANSEFKYKLVQLAVSIKFDAPSTRN